jgi:siroheme synthase-like protein
VSAVAEPARAEPAGGLAAAPPLGAPEQRYYPVFLDLRGRLVVVVGGGRVAEEKTRGLLAAGARVRLVSPELETGLAALVASACDAALALEHRARDFEAGDLDGAALVFAERLGAEAEHRIFAAAEARQLFVNVQDRVPLCTFIAASVVRRGDLQIAISTSGSAPALAVRLREKLERELGPEIAELLDLARRSRAPLAAAVPDFEERRRRWYELVDSEVLELLASGERVRAERRVVEILGVEAEPGPR